MKRMNNFYFVLFVGILLLVAGLSLKTGKNSLTFSQLGRVLFAKGLPSQELLLMQFRMPRVLVAIMAGGGLAAAGFLLQGVTQNDLADSSILGINSGAGLFVLVYLIFFNTGIYPWLLPIFACAGSFLSGGLVYLSAHRKKMGITVNRLLLAGITMNAGISALTLFLTIRISKQSYAFVTSWLAGSIWGSSWQYVQIIFVVLATVLPLSMTQIKALQVMSFGDEAAISLGINVVRRRQIALLLAIILAGSCVSVAGSISFVGLVAPHIGKKLAGSASKSGYLLGVLTGGILVLIGDTIGKNILTSGEVPAGILVALIGAPYFVYLLMRQY